MATNIFLLWRRLPDDRLEPDQVANKVQKIFSPLFDEELKITMRQNNAVVMVYLELPPRDWKVPFFQEDDETWAVAPDYPVNAESVLTPNEKHQILPALGRNLKERPFEFLRKLAPPFSLAWFSKLTGETFVQNDGLGQAQLFEYEQGPFFAITNRLFALKALNLSLEPIPEEWAVRWTLGWFPKNLSGYKFVKFVEPGTQLRFSEKGITRTRHDVLTEWIVPKPQTDLNELARSSLLNFIKSVVPLIEKKPTLMFSGGWDSRAIASSMKSLGVQFTAKVTGLPGHPDVVVASELAKIADLDLVIDHAGGLPAEDLSDCRKRISLALLWEAGYRLTRKHKLFLNRKAQKHLGRGNIKISGKHGEIGRGFYSKKWDTEIKAAEQERRFVERMMGHMPRFTRPHLHSKVRNIISETYNQANKYGLEGLQRQDFFYLYERNRRAQSGSHSAKTGMVITPFLNPDYISASFSLTHFEKTNNPFHRYIIEKNTPEWKDVPYSAKLTEEELEWQETVNTEEKNWRQPTGGRNYDNLLYWKNFAKPLVDECLTTDGFWTEIFDPDLAKVDWIEDPDSLVISCLLSEVLDL